MEDLTQQREAYSVAEVAQLFGVNVVTVYRKIYSGELFILKGFGRTKIPRSEVQKLVLDPVVYTPRKKTKPKRK